MTMSSHVTGLFRHQNLTTKQLLTHLSNSVSGNMSYHTNVSVF